jgi:hypothetical protein
MPPRDFRGISLRPRRSDSSISFLSFEPLSHGHSITQEHEEAFSWSEVKRGVFNLQVWFTATAYFGILAGLYSFGLFVRQLISIVLESK